MRILSSLLRYLLNINTVWGLMILIAFLACVLQHYLPTTTIIPADKLHDGENKLTIRIQTPGKPVQSFDYEVALGPGGLAIPESLRVPGKDRPWLISARAAGKGWLLTWDYAGYGQYELTANGRFVRHGLLVTLQSLTDAGFDYATKGFTIALGLIAPMVLFLGLMKAGEDAGIVGLVSRAFHPLIRLIFPGIPRDHPANGAVLMNITTGILGLGNAATPMGLKAMKELESLNPHPGIATDSQVMLLAWNTGGLALLPTTLLAVRKAVGCSDPFEVIGTCLVAGATSTIVALLAARLLAKLPVFSVRAAMAEEAAQVGPVAVEGADPTVTTKEDK
jgi:spore maturation protein A